MDGTINDTIGKHPVTTNILIATVTKANPIVSPADNDINCDIVPKDLCLMLSSCCGLASSKIFFHSLFPSFTSALLTAPIFTCTLLFSARILFTSSITSSTICCKSSTFISCNPAFCIASKNSLTFPATDSCDDTNVANV